MKFLNCLSYVARSYTVYGSYIAGQAFTQFFLARGGQKPNFRKMGEQAGWSSRGVSGNFCF